MRLIDAIHADHTDITDFIDDQMLFVGGFCIAELAGLMMALATDHFSICWPEGLVCQEASPNDGVDCSRRGKV